MRSPLNSRMNRMKS